MAAPIQKKHMQIIEHVSGYDAAIRLASEPLLNDGYITNDYVEAMIESIKKHGPYIVLAEEFALPHARPSEAVLETGLSLLLVQKGVDLEGRNVKLFIVLAAKDSTSHQDYLKGLAEFLMEPANLKAVLACEDVDCIKTILDERWSPSS